MHLPMRSAAPNRWVLAPRALEYREAPGFLKGAGRASRGNGSLGPHPIPREERKERFSFSKVVWYQDENA